MASDVEGTRLPIDSNNNALQLLTPPHQTTGVTNAALAAGSTATALPTGARVVEIAVQEDAFILFGLSGDTVSSTTGIFMPKGAVVYRVPDSSTHLIHLAASTTGRISITKLV